MFSSAVVPKKSFYTEKYKNLPNSCKKHLTTTFFCKFEEIFQSERQLLDENYQNKHIDLEKSELQKH